MKIDKKIKIIVTSFFVLLLNAIIILVMIGNEFKYKSSDSLISMAVPSAGTDELIDGVIISQTFISEFDIINEICINFATYNRENKGTVEIVIKDYDTNEILAIQTTDVDNYIDVSSFIISLKNKIDNCYDRVLLIELTSDSIGGSGVCPLKSDDTTYNNLVLSVNDRQMNGSLCMSISGANISFFCRYYWIFATAIICFICLYFIFVCFCYRKKKKIKLLSLIDNEEKYSFLIKQFISRDFKTKYKRSALGVLWSFMNPLLYMSIQYVVFSSLFKFDIEHFPVYLLCGNIAFNFFTEATNLSLSSITGNSGLVTKVYVPVMLYPITRLASSLINLLISFIPLILVSLFAGVYPTVYCLLLPFGIFCFAVFAFGVGLILASLMVFFRDTQFLWGICIVLLSYLTPIFYPISIIPQNLLWMIKINPLYYYIDFIRSCMLNAKTPDLITFAYCIIFAVLSFEIGKYIFNKVKDKFILYL